MTTIQIDDRLVQAEAGEMLIAATDRIGVYIPRFCYHEKLSIAANCRMCLVEVGQAPAGDAAKEAGGARKIFAREDIRFAPKPLPACATPVSDGMVVYTKSEATREAQQGTLEFLLINHPLDCPVCDQGGECPLQDQAMGYGADDSRFTERKRAVPSHDLGPLIATEMTRCIHCTRCVRFGEEVAGAMEMGMPGRGEHAWIGTFLNRTVDSEVSGNMIDLCPVGALTSKPYRFAARAWELQNHRAVSPHDCVGANLNVQTLRGRVERVLPRENAEVNECWLADRDRYSYEAVNSAARLQSPMLRRDGEWRETSWEAALAAAAKGLRKVVGAGGESAGDLGVLAGYTATLEEYFLLQKLARGLGCNNVDHRLQQCDFRDDAAAAVMPGSELPIASFDALPFALLVGCNVRKEQPLLALRLRAAVAAGGSVAAINAMAYAQNFAVRHELTVAAELAGHLAAVAAAVAEAAGLELPGEIAARATAGDEAHAAIARELLAAGKGAAVILGAAALQHADAAALRAIATWLCERVGVRMAVLAPGNSAAAWWAGCVPHRGPGGEAAAGTAGLNAGAMLARPRRGYVLFGCEPVLDGMHARAGEALAAAEFVVAVSAFRPEAGADYADVLLPMAAFTETAGHYVNCEGRVQRADAAVTPPGEARPGWKILRVLGNFLQVSGFEYVDLAQVNDDIPHFLGPLMARSARWRSAMPGGADSDAAAVAEIPADESGDATGDDDSAAQLVRLADMPMYRGDQTVRHAAALQRTADNPRPGVGVNAGMLAELGGEVDAEVIVFSGQIPPTPFIKGGNGGRQIPPATLVNGAIRLPLRLDNRVPDGCVYIPAGHPETAALPAGRVQLQLAQ